MFVICCLKRFQLYDFQKFWKAKLGRKEININVAHSRVMHGNGALSFERKYDFAWVRSPPRTIRQELVFEQNPLALGHAWHETKEEILPHGGAAARGQRPRTMNARATPPGTRPHRKKPPWLLQTSKLDILRGDLQSFHCTFIAQRIHHHPGWAAPPPHTPLYLALSLPYLFLDWP